MRIQALAVALALSAVPCHAAEPAVDAAEVASATFVKGCVGFMGDYAKLRDQLQPERDLYLPQIPPSAAKPFLQGREGEAYARFDAGVTLVLWKAEDQCAVFMQKGNTDRLRKQLDADLKAGLSRSFTIKSGGCETKGSMQSCFTDITPMGEYRAELMKKYGKEPAGLRVLLTTSESANPNLKAIITVDWKLP
ncbi:hypothetical protein CU669_03040 [Paramagnetospirillum kuznetsovii]|uniref:Uncharacterized protein n=1 Tax=Paramagnetospirillum kuznetsovii TaxID=2053833 RepID=A0A364P1G5_9PROT|nr:hypothetical protein [Paramagnetospirillum kuznetsovii]RAU23153.1 hypothetical protein CU669_03040 [Paramagnetospirillum kuznetsovii]